MDNRPQSREKHVTNNSKGVARRGDGLSSSNPSGKKPVAGKAAAGGGAVALIAIIGMLLKGLLGGGGGSASQTTSDDLSAYDPSVTTEAPADPGVAQQLTETTTANYVGELVQNNHPDGTANAGMLDTSVVEGARAKYTTIKGNGEDTVTIMIYMCGTDLESKYGMATKDITEMTKATVSGKINIIIYTGGCNKWNNSLFSSSTNQIWKITNGSMQLLVEDDGNKSMTDPNTLSSFIKYCNQNYPADRKDLIMWDHGGGSITGYGYDEKKGHSGSMTLAMIDSALKSAGVKFDFIGFDACLMATLEAGLTMEPYADYYIASEETEPGVGWYYTNWLTNLSKNTSTPTVEIGKWIIDDFVTECNRTCNGQKTTLSIVDLAQLKATVPDKLTAFASSVNTMIEEKDYKTVSDARYQTREFAQSSKIDQIDLVDLANKVGSKEAKELASSIQSCVKYNRTSSNMTNAYGVSIYFPYRKVSNVDNAVSQYQKLGMDNEYTKCISAFAQVETSGQVSSSGTSNPLNSLLGGGGNNAITGLFQAFGFMKSMPEEAQEYVDDNKFDASVLQWKTVNGKQVISMSEEQWSMVHDITINMFFDDGTGYIDLGNDNLFEFDEQGNMVADDERTWIAIDGQPVAYYYMDTTVTDDRYSIMGYVPALLNDKRVQIILIFDTEHPEGYIAGARDDYGEEETETVAKALVQLREGDKLDFICDYYDYDGNKLDSYFLGEQMTLSAAPEISNVPIEGNTLITYKFTDMYNQTYWTPVLR